MQILLYVMISLSHTLFGVFSTKHRGSKILTLLLYIAYFGIFIAYCFAPLPVWLKYLSSYFVYIILFLSLCNEKFWKSVFLLTSYTVMFTIFFSSVLCLILIPEEVIFIRWILIFLLYGGLQTAVYLLLVPVFHHNKDLGITRTKWIQFCIGNLIFLLLIFSETIWPIKIENSDYKVVLIFVFSSLAYFFTFHMVFYNLSNTAKIELTSMENSRLKQMAYRDSLTGLLNKTAYDAHIEDIIENGNKNNLISIVVMDINKFKAINDNFGHLKGDEVLKNVGKIISEDFPDNTFKVFRIGGDEFSVICENIDDPSLEQKLDSLNAHLNEKVKVTVAKGYAHVNYSNINPFRTAFKNADKNMYRDKFVR